MSSDMTEMGDEFTIVANESEKALYFGDILEWNFPIGDCFHLFWIDCDFAVGYDVSQVFY